MRACVRVCVDGGGGGVWLLLEYVLVCVCVCVCSIANMVPCVHLSLSLFVCMCGLRVCFYVCSWVVVCLFECALVRVRMCYVYVYIDTEFLNIMRMSFPVLKCTYRQKMLLYHLAMTSFAGHVVGSSI